MADAFSPGAVVWVKCGQAYWPSKVVGEADWDEELRESIRQEKKKPKLVVKFFNEDGYEFLNDTRYVYHYNCDKKVEFIKKGLAKSRNKGASDGGWFEKFPKDIVLCEELVEGGDPKILEKDPFVERKQEKVNYKELFGAPEEREKEKEKKDRKRKGGDNDSSGTPRAKKDKKDATPNRKIVHPRFVKGGASDHQVRMMLQPSTPYHLDLLKSQEAKDNSPSSSTAGLVGSSSTPRGAAGSPAAAAAASSSAKFNCHICGFAANRLNVFMMHSKTHRYLLILFKPAT